MRGRSLTPFPMGDCGEKRLCRRVSEDGGNASLLSATAARRSKLWKVPLKRDERDIGPFVGALPKRFRVAV